MKTGADAGDTSGFPWARAAAVAAPGVALAAAAGAIGFRSGAGLALLVAGISYLGLDVALLQPRLARAPEDKPGAAAQEFLRRALEITQLGAISREFGRAVSSAMGPTRAALLAPDPDGGLQVLSGAGEAVERDLGDPNEAFRWLGRRRTPLRRADVASSDEEGAAATLSLLDALQCDVLLPLRHRGLLLGLGLLHEGGTPFASDPRAEIFYQAMRAYTTVAVANTFLDAATQNRGRLTQAFDLATAAQEALLPDERPVVKTTYELRGICRPVAECGGDLWAWRELPGGRVLVVVADATGHGAAPALLAAVAKGAIDAHWQTGRQPLDPAELLAGLNRAVYRTGQTRYMMTAFAAVLDTGTGELTYANAGQNFPFILSSGRPEPLIARGNSLGAAAEAEYETHRRTMGAGETLVLYTDGVVDAGAPLIEPYGEKRFRALLTALSDQRATRIPEVVAAQIDEYLFDAERSDDITVVALSRGDAGEAA